MLLPAILLAIIEKIKIKLEPGEKRKSHTINLG